MKQTRQIRKKTERSARIRMFKRRMSSEQSRLLKYLFPHDFSWSPFYESERKIISTIHLSQQEDDLAQFLIDPDPKIREFAKFKYNFIVKLKQLEGSK